MIILTTKDCNLFQKDWENTNTPNPHVFNALEYWLKKDWPIHIEPTEPFTSIKKIKLFNNHFFNHLKSFHPSKKFTKWLNNGWGKVFKQFAKYKINPLGGGHRGSSSKRFRRRARPTFSTIRSISLQHIASHHKKQHLTITLIFWHFGRILTYPQHPEWLSEEFSYRLVKLFGKNWLNEYEKLMTPSQELVWACLFLPRGRFFCDIIGDY